VSIPFKWFSQNPFRSTYFACLSMAAEMSTGALALGHLYKRKPTVSMLVVKTEGEYFKKAVGRTYFTCEDGAAIQSAVERDRAVRQERAEFETLRGRLASLTPREREVLPLVVSGLLNKQAAAELGISEVTLQIHRSKIMQKMEAASLADLVRIAEKLQIPITHSRRAGST